jgi:hypothetical protein
MREVTVLLFPLQLPAPWLRLYTISLSADRQRQRRNMRQGKNVGRVAAMMLEGCKPHTLSREDQGAWELLEADVLASIRAAAVPPGPPPIGLQSLKMELEEGTLSAVLCLFDA